VVDKLTVYNSWRLEVDELGVDPSRNERGGDDEAYGIYSDHSIVAIGRVVKVLHLALWRRHSRAIGVEVARHDVLGGEAHAAGKR
jgi:hypothetical protein